MLRRLLIILPVVSLAFAIAYLAGAFDPKHNGKPLLLEWVDPESGIVFRVTESPGPLVKQNTRLYVQMSGEEKTIGIDDDAMFGTIAFVRFESWLLVVCRGVDEVWAAYNYHNGALYGEYDWSQLPFTRWNGQGVVVTER